MTKLKQMLLAALLLFSFAAVPATVNAQNIKKNLCRGIELRVNEECDVSAQKGASTNSVNRTIGLVINVLSWIVGVVAVIMIIIGGFKYITSAGDAGNVTSAKNTILYAIVGLVIVALAQVIVRFVLSSTPG